VQPPSPDAVADPDAPIGIFDSGFGGLTVARSVIDQLPHESILYVGDTARAPYGPKPIAEVREYALECLDHLVEQGVKALVIACNSASAAMLRDARERYDGCKCNHSKYFLHGFQELSSTNRIADAFLLSGIYPAS